MYDRAAAAASRPPQQVHYRLSRARYAETASATPRRRSKLYQEILSDAQMRAEPLHRRNHRLRPHRRRRVAEKAIDHVVTPGRRRRSTSPYQKAAAKALAEAQQDPRPGASCWPWRRCTPTPPSPPHGDARRRRRLRGRRHRQRAVHVLRPMYFKYPDSPEKPRIIEAMARNYLAAAQPPSTPPPRRWPRAATLGEATGS